MRTPSRSAVVAAGVTLLIAPLIAIALKLLFYPGWMMLIIIFISPALILGYVAQIVAASASMFPRRGALNVMPGAGRALTAAYVTSFGIVLAAASLIDGGDDGTYGSAFTELFGISSTPGGESASFNVFVACALVWVAGWGWFMIEWIVLSARKRRAAVPALQLKPVPRPEG